MKFYLLLFLFAFSVTLSYSANEPVPGQRNKVSKEKLLRLVNKVRKKGVRCGRKRMPPVSPIKWNDKLAKAAYDHSRDMHRKNYFSHTSKDGRRAGDRIRKVGYEWYTYGENIAWGQSSEEEVSQTWIKSSGHCKNIMKAGVSEMGVGRSGNYWTQVFAAGR